jgi:1,4-alpha-glucan branching enzyme
MSSILSFVRIGKAPESMMMIVANFTPVPRYNYRVGAPRNGFWKEVLNSDAAEYGGSNHGNLGGGETTPLPYHGHRQSLNLILPPLGVVFLKYMGPVT